jgi:hypothetical protein
MDARAICVAGTMQLDRRTKCRRRSSLEERDRRSAPWSAPAQRPFGAAGKVFAAAPKRCPATALHNLAAKRSFPLFVRNSDHGPSPITCLFDASALQTPRSEECLLWPRPERPLAAQPQAARLRPLMPAPTQSHGPPSICGEPDFVLNLSRVGNEKRRTAKQFGVCERFRT